ncbi:MAG: VOC family protein [Candidatus Aminicenantes bacterium]|nr:VOC family protein [Candidatus Aminicenantes bacterium]
METKSSLKIGLVSIYVNSPETAFNFYTEVLGFVKVIYLPEAKLAIVASPLDPQGTALLLEPNENPIANRYQKEIYETGLPAIVLSTENIFQEYERLKKLGVKFKQEPIETEWGILAIFDDTCGNWIQLHQPLK